MQKASEIRQEVKSRGNNLLSAMEKEDNEALAILRARHERIVMEMAEHVRYASLQEAIKFREALLKSLALAVQRYVYYERQLGKKTDDIEKAVPELGELDKGNLDKMKFAMEESEIGAREIEMDIEQNLLSGLSLFSGDSDGKIVSSCEAKDLEKSGSARDIHAGARALQLAAQSFTMIPDTKIHGHYWGVGGSIGMGGQKIAAGVKCAAEAIMAYADDLNIQASQAAKIGSYARREQDWILQKVTWPPARSPRPSSHCVLPRSVRPSPSRS